MINKTLLDTHLNRLKLRVGYTPISFSEFHFLFSQLNNSRKNYNTLQLYYLIFAIYNLKVGVYSLFIYYYLQVSLSESEKDEFVNEILLFLKKLILDHGLSKENQNLNFSNQEFMLVKLLSKSSMHKIDVIKYLFAEELDYVNAENRLKNLLFRLNKKNPYFISLDGEVLKINSSPLQVIHKFKKELCSLKFDDHLAQIVSSSLMQLYSIKNELKVSTQVDFYLNALIYYFEGDQQKLQSLISDYLSKYNFHEYVFLAQLRLEQLKKDEVSFELVNQNSNILRDQRSLVWAEYLSINARFHDLRGRDNEAWKLYDSAAKIYANFGVHNKSLRQQLNSLICLERLNSSSNDYIKKYRRLLFLGLNHKENMIVATCLTIISQRFFYLGAYNLSLKYINRSILFYSKSNVGSINYFNSIAHRVLILHLIGHTDRAQKEIEYLKISQHNEISQLYTHLNYILKYNELPKNINVLSIPQSWIFYFSEFKTKITLSTQEESLIGILIRKNYTRRELIEKLWGSNIVSEFLILRFKKLMNRLRSKSKHLITFSFGKYEINSSLDYFKSHDSKCGV